MNRALLTPLILFGLAAEAAAQQPTVQPIELTFRPAEEPSPALKYHLLPWPREQKPGNAALHYHRAALLRDSLPKDAPDKVYKYGNLSLNDLPRNEVRQLLQTCRHVLDEVELAAHSDRCEWQLKDQLRIDGIGLLIPEIQRQREFAAILKLKARFEIAEGRYDDALGTIRTGFAMARHGDQMPTLISSLVAVAITAIMANELDTLIDRPGAPNLYWALNELPRPFIDMREAFQTERFMVDSMFPGVRELMDNPRAPPMTPAQVQALAEKLPMLVASAEGGSDRAGARLEAQLGLAVLAAKLYPEAKQFLISRGRTAAQVEAMPMLPVVLFYQLHQYDEHFDDMVKWLGLPYWEARPGLLRAEERMKRERQRTSGISLTLASLLLPAVQKVFQAQVRLDRKFAALRTVEAIRLYAAAHGRKAPATLADIKEVPVPVDPVTGKMFEYQATNLKVTLTAPPWPGQAPNVGNTLRYELTLAR